jgi:hypothetical protein
LKTAVNDVQAVGQLLHGRYGFQVEYLLNGDATRYKILSALGRYRASLREDDNLLIYYGGHGYFDHDTDKAYWLPVDADSGTSPNTIMADDLTSVLRALPSRHVLVVSDSCYSGGLSRGANEPTRTGGNAALLKRELGSRSRTLMASGGLEPVADAGGSGHSVFASAFLRGLQQAEDPSFTAIDIFYTAIRRQVAGISSQLPEYSALRNSGDDSGDFVFVVKDAAFASEPAPTLAGLSKGGITPIPFQASQSGFELLKAGKYAEALPLLTIACDGGEAIGCSNLGQMFENGKGVAEDDARAARFYQEGCEGGSPDGCYKLGSMYENGRGVTENLFKAVSFYRKGCDGGSAPGCTGLAFMYENGNGVGEDDAKAVSLYRTVCDEGEADGCAYLGLMYMEEKGVPKDYAQAASLFRKGCDGGNMLGCSNLGVMFEHGLGIGEDKAQALNFYRKACDGGEAKGCKNLKRLQP